ncbi:MAG: helix-turn-helix transcriptional regulator [Pseudomonadota bacterium]
MAVRDTIEASDVLSAQRGLRRMLLDAPTVRYEPSRDLAAHMLLYLDDLPYCWGIATAWLRNELSCHRVDTGFGTAAASEYFPGFSEAKNADYDVPSFGGFAVDNRDPIMQAMWSGSKPVIFADLKQDRRVTPKLRKRMAGARTKSKFGAALRNSDGGFGLICADWTEHEVPRDGHLFDCFEQTVQDVLSPIIGAARAFADTQLDELGTDPATDAPEAESQLGALTSSELEIARLVARGLSYKEIARIRNRSLSTIDHQLRSIRAKLGVTSTANLISRLAGLDGFRH